MWDIKSRASEAVLGRYAEGKARKVYTKQPFLKGMHLAVNFSATCKYFRACLLSHTKRKETQTKAMEGPAVFCWARFFKSMCIDLALNFIWSKFKHQHKPGDTLNVTITELLPTSSCSAFPSASCSNTDAAFCNAFVTALISSVTLFLSWISAFTESLWSWAFLYNLWKITRKNTLL